MPPFCCTSPFAFIGRGLLIANRVWGRDSKVEKERKVHPRAEGESGEDSHFPFSGWRKMGSLFGSSRAAAAAAAAAAAVW